ncbi:hypothetical protein PENTCL1PPCAC_367, partial [Pristionchus entomophagus]
AQVPPMPPVLDTSNPACKAANIKSDASNRPFPCLHCPFRAQTVKQMEEHVLAGHAIMKQFKCPHCTFSSSAKRSLTAHLKWHENIDGNPQNAVVLTRIEPEPEKIALCLSRDEKKMRLKNQLMEECFSVPI